MTPERRVVVLALSGLVALGGLNERLTGTATPLPPPRPLPVGTCLQDLVGFEAVPCDLEHEVEVISSWPGGPADGPPTARDGHRPAAPDVHCQRTVDQVVKDVRAAAGDALLPPRSSWFGRVVVGPDHPRTAPWPVSACIAGRPPLHDADTSVSGSLRELETDPARPRPSSMRRCLESSLSDVRPCSLPHDTEILAESVQVMSDAELRQDRAEPEPTALKTFGAQCVLRHRRASHRRAGPTTGG